MNQRISPNRSGSGAQKTHHIAPGTLIDSTERRANHSEAQSAPAGCALAQALGGSIGQEVSLALRSGMFIHGVLRAVGADWAFVAARFDTVVQLDRCDWIEPISPSTGVAPGAGARVFRDVVEDAVRAHRRVRLWQWETVGIMTAMFSGVVHVRPEGQAPRAVQLAGIEGFEVRPA